MPRVPFHELPDESRLWVFPANRRLDAAEEASLRARVEEFLSGWAAHGRLLKAGMEWREGQFLFVAVDDSDVPPSGCSIDALVNKLRELEGENGLTLLDRSPVWYRADGEIRCVTRGEFGVLVEGGRVDEETAVFDPSITRMSQLRGGLWEKPAGAGWHRRAFFSV
jgi:hypothetical protein